MNKLKLKVCGMREPENIDALLQLQPEFVGFIFYERSVRYAGGMRPEVVMNIPSGIKKVGVFVNASLDEIEARISRFNLDYAQLHGDESFEFVQEVSSRGIKVIKVFGVEDALPDNLMDFEGLVDYVLLDTKTKNYGGSGQQFQWKILKDYQANIPLILSGGISLDDIAAIKTLQVKNLIGIDVNSRFELAPGVKDVKMVEELISQL